MGTMEKVGRQLCFAPPTLFLWSRFEAQANWKHSSSQVQHAHRGTDREEALAAVGIGRRHCSAWHGWAW